MEAAVTTLDLDAVRGEASPELQEHIAETASGLRPLDRERCVMRTIGDDVDPFVRAIAQPTPAAAQALSEAGHERLHPCSQCNRSFPTDHYKRDQTKDAGIQSICRSCRRVADVTTGIRKHLRTSGISFETDEQVLIWMRYAVNAALAGDSEVGEGNLARALISCEDTIAVALDLGERPWNGPVTHSVPEPAPTDNRVTELREQLERLQGAFLLVSEQVRDLELDGR